MIEERIEKLRDITNVQGSDGNWNYDEYMRGMYNGMELALATIEGREPVYKESGGQALGANDG